MGINCDLDPVEDFWSSKEMIVVVNNLFLSRYNFEDVSTDYPFTEYEFYRYLLDDKKEEFGQEG